MVDLIAKNIAAVSYLADISEDRPVHITITKGRWKLRVEAKVASPGFIQWGDALHEVVTKMRIVLSAHKEAGTDG